MSTQKKTSIKTFIFIAFALFALVCHAQPNNFNTQRNWSISKKELSFGGGVTQFAGDLGGMNKGAFHGDYIEYNTSGETIKQIRYKEGKKIK